MFEEMPDLSQPYGDDKQDKDDLSDSLCPLDEYP
jgi:hypothetical protein